MFLGLPIGKWRRIFLKTFILNQHRVSLYKKKKNDVSLLRFDIKILLVNTIHYTLYAIHYMLYTIHYTLYPIHYTLYAIRYTTLHYTTLYTVYFTLIHYIHCALDRNSFVNVPRPNWNRLDSKSVSPEESKSLWFWKFPFSGHISWPFGLQPLAITILQCAASLAMKSGPLPFFKNSYPHVFEKF